MRFSLMALLIGGGIMLGLYLRHNARDRQLLRERKRQKGVRQVLAEARQES